ncbi:hypothetical protein HK099_006439 [Clydaea vesicula]|uniref:Uncharacterized protein n=1 Tax=Clydaea vesicula TaxID=447962 RepID=A0AAD5TZX5_9FUNG|nr:hypothetical protein HK099_006439 [Clydaea vesicula]
MDCSFEVQALQMMKNIAQPNSLEVEKKTENNHHQFKESTFSVTNKPDDNLTKAKKSYDVIMTEINTNNSKLTSTLLEITNNQNQHISPSANCAHNVFLNPVFSSENRLNENSNQTFSNATNNQLNPIVTQQPIPIQNQISSSVWMHNTPTTAQSSQTQKLLFTSHNNFNLSAPDMINSSLPQPFSNNNQSIPQQLPTTYIPSYPVVSTNNYSNQQILSTLSQIPVTSQQYISALPDQFPVTTQHFVSATTQFLSTTPQYVATTAEPLPTTTQYLPTTTLIIPTTQFNPSTTQYVTSAPVTQFMATNTNSHHPTVSHLLQANNVPTTLTNQQFSSSVSQFHPNTTSFVTHSNPTLQLHNTNTNEQYLLSTSSKSLPNYTSAIQTSSIGSTPSFSQDQKESPASLSNKQIPHSLLSNQSNTSISSQPNSLVQSQPNSLGQYAPAPMSSASFLPLIPNVNNTILNQNSVVLTTQPQNIANSMLKVDANNSFTHPVISSLEGQSVETQSTYRNTQPPTSSKNLSTAVAALVNNNPATSNAIVTAVAQVVAEAVRTAVVQQQIQINQQVEIQQEQVFQQEQIIAQQQAHIQAQQEQIIAQNTFQICQEKALEEATAASEKAQMQAINTMMINDQIQQQFGISPSLLTQSHEAEVSVKKEVEATNSEENLVKPENGNSAEIDRDNEVEENDSDGALSDGNIEEDEPMEKEVLDFAKLEENIDSRAFDAAENIPDIFETSVFYLYKIIRHKLYKPMYRTQADYGLKRWGLTSGRLCQILGCEPILRTLADFERRPHCEKVCRTLQSCVKDSSPMISLPQLWSRSLLECTEEKVVSSTVIMKAHKTLMEIEKSSFASSKDDMKVDKKRNSGHDPLQYLEFNVPENLAEHISDFFNGKLSIDPLWNPSSFINPSRKFFINNDIIADPLNESWVDGSLNCSCFLPLIDSSNDYSFAQKYYEKLQEEIANGHVKEALVLAVYDLSIPWVRSALEKSSSVFLFPQKFVPLSGKISVSIKKRTRKRARLSSSSSSSTSVNSSSSSPDDDGVGYCLIYQGPRNQKFYNKFKNFGLCPGLNCPSFK